MAKNDTAEVVSAVAELVAALKSNHPVTIKNTKEENEKELLQICVGELNELYESIEQSMEHVRTKGLALLAGEIAIATFLFSPQKNGFFTNNVPLYGFVMFGLGIFLLFFSAGVFLYVLSKVKWKRPPEEADIANINKRFNSSPYEFLEYMKDGYTSAINHCGEKVTKRANALMVGIYSFSFGIALVILVKYCGNLIKLGVK